MSRDEINTCPVEHWTGPISVVRTNGELTAAMRKLVGHSLLGFDTETRPAFKKGESYLPSVLKLATNDEVFIFQLKHLGLATPLHDILADPAIIKAGVGLNYDISELKKMSHFKTAGFMDLNNLANNAGIKNQGLRGLAAVLLGFRITKGAQKSNWANDVLTPQQIQYAATDAWVGRRLYLTPQLRHVSALRSSGVRSFSSAALDTLPPVPFRRMTMPMPVTSQQETKRFL
jgi:ribonuclease D